LSPGDCVRLVSPASRPDRAWLTESVEVLEGWGLRVEVGRHASDEWGYMAGRDADRLADLNDAFRDPSVRAVITTRGGAGSYRIADGIDFDAVRADPKPLVGLSDITNLHLALWTHARLATVHGCLAGPSAAAGVRALLMTTAPLIINRNPEALSAAVEVSGRCDRSARRSSPRGHRPGRSEHHPVDPVRRDGRHRRHRTRIVRRLPRLRRSRLDRRRRPP